MIRLALPVSTVLPMLPKAFVDSFQVMEYKFFDSAFVAPGKEYIFHSSLSLVQDDFYEVIEEQKAIEFLKARQIRRFSLDIGPRYGTCKVVEGKYVGLSRKLEIDEILGLCEERLAFLRKNLPETCELAIENLNYYHTDAYEGVCDAAFYNMACLRLGVQLVLDQGHAEVTDINLNQARGAFFREINPRLVSEVQLSKIGTDGKVAWDGHLLPDEHELAIVDELLPQLEHPVDLVVEYFREPNGLIAFYEKIRKRWKGT